MTLFNEAAELKVDPDDEQPNSMFYPTNEEILEMSNWWSAVHHKTKEGLAKLAIKLLICTDQNQIKKKEIFYPVKNIANHPLRLSDLDEMLKPKKVYLVQANKFLDINLNFVFYVFVDEEWNRTVNVFLNFENINPKILERSSDEIDSYFVRFLGADFAELERKITRKIESFEINNDSKNFVQKNEKEQLKIFKQTCNKILRSEIYLENQNIEKQRQKREWFFTIKIDQNLTWKIELKTFKQSKKNLAQLFYQNRLILKFNPTTATLRFLEKFNKENLN